MDYSFLALQFLLQCIQRVPYIALQWGNERSNPSDPGHMECQETSESDPHQGKLQKNLAFCTHPDVYGFKGQIYVYCTWRWPHMSYCIMLIHGHCTLMYLGLLYVFAVMCRVVSLYSADWMAGSSTWFFINSFLGWTYNVFWPSYDPSDLTH